MLSMPSSNHLYGENDGQEASKNSWPLLQESSTSPPIDGSIVKKLNHNARERIRRMKLNDSYLALQSLLPDSRRSKKKWSAPVMIDRALEYIPELENEIEKLTQRKDHMLSIVEKNQFLDQTPPLKSQVPTVSVSAVTKCEVVIQICMKREQSNVFSTLLANVEDEGMCITTASTLSVCDDRVCYHLHLHMNGDSLGDNYIVVLRDKVVSWLCDNIDFES
ncbi:hypothetical protein HHK36_004321 [Tetracentron sinense]|uniref:BHLH domain-containing protein n=1 Tax=Tetracentron sinense TaxID=13715 RepID=A0A835DPD2_TETSI|nr:hypothetical protein HHK36_004321 [Tetracentron sinense]